MECVACGHDNVAGARFCSRCGTPMARSCPVCEHAIGPDDRFCSHCGTDLAEAVAQEPAGPDLARYVPEPLLRKMRAARDGQAMRGERRTVTMLFADIEGSTAAAELLDPEDWAEVVNGAFERLIAPVYRYEGTLARLQGDAVLAFFGAPIAHEDDPVRAVHAALEMRAALLAHAREVHRIRGLELAARIGINTGLVVVGEVGSDLRVEYTALGDAINVAARMEQTAAPGTVRITEHTAALLGGAFELDDLGAVEVKGKAAPVRAYRVVCAAPRAAPRTSSAPLVGRELALEQLRTVVRTISQGSGAVATVVGEAGIGKSRLLAALRDELSVQRRLASRADSDGDLSWMEGGPRSFDVGVPYAPFLELGRRWFGWDEYGPRARYDTIAAAARTAIADIGDDDVALLAHLGDAQLPPAAARLVEQIETPVLHERTTDAVVSYLEAVAARRPLVVVLEDLHWADTLSLALAERLIASTARVPMGLVLTLRQVPDAPAWRLVQIASTDAAERYTALQLRPLDDDATETLLRSLLGTRELTPSERSQILERADGNPLFLEQVVRALSDGEHGDVPASLTGLLSARLDRLDEPSRTAVTGAAVIGREFDPAVLGDLVDGIDVDRAISDLVGRGLLRERQTAAGRSVAFRHALLQEVAYGTVLLRERRALHGRVARHLAVIQPENPHEVARHHLASATPEAALPWLVAAGQRSARAMALEDAIGSFETAIDLAGDDDDPDVVAQAHEGLGAAHDLVPDLDHATAAYQSFAEFGRTCSRPSLEVRALNRLAMSVATIGGDLHAAKAHLSRAREVAEAADDDAGLAEYHMNACYISAALGELDTAIHHDEETDRLGKALGDQGIRASGLVRRAMNLMFSLRFDLAEQAAEDAQAIIGRLGPDAEQLANDLQGDVLSHLRERAGDLPGALEALTAARAASERIDRFYTAMLGWHLGQVAARAGDLEMALTHHGEALRRAERRGQAFVIAAASGALSRLYGLTGVDDASIEHGERALEALDRPFGEFLATSVWADVAAGRLHRGDLSGAEDAFDRALTSSSMVQLWDRPRVLAGLARTLIVRGDTSRSAELIARAEELTGPAGLRVDAPLVAAVAARAATASGDLAAAERRLHDAATGAASMGLRLVALDVAVQRRDVATLDGRPDDARQHHVAARDLAEGLLAPIADPGLRASFAAGLDDAVGAPTAPAP